MGDVSIDRIVEGAPDTMPMELFSGPAAAAFARQRSRMPATWFDMAGSPLLPISAFVLATADLTVLVDSCVGSWPTPLSPGGAQHSDFLDNLASAGYSPEDIDVVVATHLHFDHIGCHTYRASDGSVQPTFPRASYLVSELEWRTQSPRSREIPALISLDHAMLPLVASGQAELISDEHEIGSGIAVLPSPGHSPGHLCVTVDSGGRSALVTGDLAHNPIQLSVPEIGSVFDQDPGLAMRSRRDLGRRCADEGTLVLGTHFPGSGIGVLERIGDDIFYVESDTPQI